VCIVAADIRRLLLSDVPRDREEHDQNRKNSPDVEAHRVAAASLVRVKQHLTQGDENDDAED
jgi:hypothetical protein